MKNFRRIGTARIESAEGKNSGLPTDSHDPEETLYLDSRKRRESNDVSSPPETTPVLLSYVTDDKPVQ
jgi:hypothetical protein